MDSEARGSSKLTTALFLVIPLAIVLTINLKVDAARPLWFDEILVSKTASLPHVSDIWALLKSGQSPHPPLHFLVVRAIYAAFGVNDLTTRLPSTLGFLSMQVCLFFFVSKRSNPAFGTVAMLLPLVTLARAYAVEAKPYGALLGWTGIALICWRQAEAGRWRIAWIAGLAAALTCAIYTHLFGLLLGAPIVLAEIVRAFDRRKIDWPLWCALLLSFLPIVFLFPIISSGRKIHAVHPWQTPLGIGFMANSMDQLMAAAAAPLLICLLVVAASRLTPPVEKEARFPPAELAAAAGVAALPLLAFCAAHLARIEFMELKYVINMIAGLAILCAWSAYAASSRRVIAGTVIAAILGIWACRDFLGDLRGAAGDRQAMAHFAPPPEVERYGPLGIVVETPLYLELTRYAPPQVAARLYFVLDPEGAYRYLHTDALQRSMLLNPAYFGAHVENVATFQSAHPEFLVYESLPNDRSWLLEKYKAQNARIELLTGNLTERWYLIQLLDRTRGEKVAGAFGMAGEATPSPPVSRRSIWKSAPRARCP